MADTENGETCLQSRHSAANPRSPSVIRKAFERQCGHWNFMDVPSRACCGLTEKHGPAKKVPGRPGAEPRAPRSRFPSMEAVQRGLTLLGTLTARPWAFLVVLAYTVVWLALQPESFDLHGAATIIVWIMTLFIQRAEHRDTQAIHAKLDELLRSAGAARSELARIDEEEPEVIEEQRSAAQAQESAGQAAGGRA